MGAGRAAAGLIVLGLAASARAGLDTTQVQADLTAVGPFGFAPMTSALFLGATGAPASAGRSGFGGMGFELTYAAPGAGPYRGSLGVQFRGGLSWGCDPGASVLARDAFVYARVTPFVATHQLYGQSSPGQWAQPDRAVPGVRVGVGVTVPWWSRFFFSESLGPFAEGHGLYRESLKVLAGLLALPIAALNHAEVTFEAFRDSSVLTHELDLRFGTGF